MCTATETSSHSVSRNLPPRAVFGLAKAMAWTTPSSFSTPRPRSCWGRAASWSSSVTSSSSTSGTGSSLRTARRVTPTARGRLETMTRAPCSWAI